MEYNLKDYGDHIEKAYVDFIQKDFKTYENVWKLFIGNNGNHKMAGIPNYPKERNFKRQKFSEHTYTILQSTILLQRLIKKPIFNNQKVNTIEDFLNFQDDLLLFFTHLGRIRDNVKDATRCLLNLSETETTSKLDEFYHKRHILVHGITLPIKIKTDGEILIPVLSRNSADTVGWYNKEHSWQDIMDLETESIYITIQLLYCELLPKLVEIFGKFNKKIIDELNANNYILKFEYIIKNDIKNNGSGSCAIY